MLHRSRSSITIQLLSNFCIFSFFPSYGPHTNPKLAIIKNPGIKVTSLLGKYPIVPGKCILREDHPDITGHPGRERWQEFTFSPEFRLANNKRIRPTYLGSTEFWQEVVKVFPGFPMLWLKVGQDPLAIECRGNSQVVIL